ncbi:MAG: DUF637 domain-containing protein [Paraburkholderia sp.]
MTVALPVATETTTTTGGQPSSSVSVISAGHNLNLTANSLGNEAGTISAGNDANLNVQSLSNGGATYSSTVTDTVSLASINSFLSQAPSTIQIWDNFYGPNALNGYTVGTYIDPAGIQLNSPGTVTPLSTSSSISVQGQTGQIVAGHNVNLSGGNLTNAGTLAAGNDVNITASSFTNQGTNTGTMTTTAGCASGYSAGCSSLSTTNPNSQTYSYQQTNSTVTAGNDIVIAANTVNNTYGTLAAGRNVAIGGAGTTASDSSTTPTNLTQAGSVTNTSGAIAGGNDVDINAATLTNTIAAPAQIHQNYGSATPFTGCTSNCEAYVDVQSAAPATITANHNVNLTAGSFSNTGSLVTALNNVTINASGTAGSNNQYLYAYWASNLTHYGTSYPAWGCANNPSLCQTLYGSAYSSGNAQDPAGLPDVVGLPDFVPATIQAGNTLSVNSPTLTNTGNVIGQSVALTGSQLVNGLTNPNVYTPPPAISGQVISLGPPAVPASATTSVNHAGLVTTLSGQSTSVTGAAGLPSTTPIGVQTVGKPVAPTTGSMSSPVATTVKTTVGGQTETVSYLVSSPASQVINDLGPSALLSALPASLQPSTTQFYYDPYTQAQQVEQAALEATGKASFYSTTSATDSTSQTSIDNQDTQALYGAALQYAEKNNIALGTELSAAQLALVNEPMLWYTEETVPEPGCTATGNGVCPTVQALMPEVLLPQNYASVSADGEISGTNVTLNYANSILNTGSISADNLTVNTGTLTNEERSTNIGTIYNEVEGGVEVTTGTVVQQGGFMSAANYNMNAQAIDDIGGAIQQVNADGSANTAATTQLLSNLKSQLGSSFTQSTVSNNLNTTLIADDSGFGLGDLFMMAVIAVISIGSAGAASAAIGGTAGATAGSGSMFAAAGTSVDGVAVGAGLGNIAATAAVGGMMDSAMSQSAFGNGSFSVGSMLAAGASAFLTAGLTNGITFNDGSLGFTLSAGNPDSLAALAGVQNVGDTLVPQAGTSTAGTLLTQGDAMAGEAVIQAGSQTLLGGGSFLTNLRNDAVSDTAAAAAYAIGNEASLDGSPMPMNSPQYVLAHALLGCAASAAGGTGCASGALGAAASAAISPDVIAAMDPSGAPLDSGQSAALAALAILAGGGASELAGGNGQVGATWAQNEALNNDAGHTATAAKTGGLVGSALTLAQVLAAEMQQGISSVEDQFTTLLDRNYGKSSPTDANNELGDWGNGPKPPMNGTAMVTTVIAEIACAEIPLACTAVAAPSSSAGYAPGNTTFSSGNNGNDGTNGGTSSATGATTSSGSGAPNSSAQKALNAVATGAPVEPTNGGFINGTKINQSGAVVQDLTSAQQDLVQQIVQNGDQSGALTESLIDSVSESGGFDVIPGGKYGSNNGFDQVLQSPNGSITVVVDSKQMNSGGISLGSSQAGMQLSQDWIEATLANLPDSSPAKAAVQRALSNGNLYTAVAGVNKSTQNVVIVPVNVH